MKKLFLTAFLVASQAFGANVIYSPYMNMPVPVVGVDTGPDWANNINTSLNILDGHNHTSGNGQQIPPAGLNINGDLTFQNNNATALKSARFQNQVTPIPAVSPSITELYVANNQAGSLGQELYYNDGAGHQVQITNAGSLAATSSGITNGNASATFSGGSLIVNQAANTPANIKGGSIFIGNNTASSNYVEISAPNALASNPQYVLPSAVPGANSFLTFDTSGNMGYTALLGALTTSNLSSSANIAYTQLGALNFQSSSSITLASLNNTSLAYATGLTITITTHTGKSLFLGLVSGTPASASYVRISSSSIETPNGQVAFYDETTAAYVMTSFIECGIVGTTGGITALPPSSFSTIFQPSAGTHTYRVYSSIASGTLMDFETVKLVAYEL